MQYLLTIYQPDGEAPPEVDLQKIMREVGVLMDEMKSKGAWVFDAGLFPPTTATVVRRQGEDFLLTDGPYTEGKEHVGGFVVVEAADLDAGLDWGRKTARVIGLPIEVRPIVPQG